MSNDPSDASLGHEQPNTLEGWNLSSFYRPVASRRRVALRRARSQSFGSVIFTMIEISAPTGPGLLNYRTAIFSDFEITWPFVTQWLL
jgi:hypothetical protein